jgi:hypothetical protein
VLLLYLELMLKLLLLHVLLLQLLELIP